MEDRYLLTLISVLLAAIGYFIKRILDQTERIHKDVSEIRPKVDILWKDKYAPAHSPRQLNERGSDILNKSGIKEIIDEKKEFLSSLLKADQLKNPYDAENAIGDIMMNLPMHCPDVVDRLKIGAFNVGSDVPGVLFVGSIYLRNLIFKDLGFPLEDLDTPKKDIDIVI